MVQMYGQETTSNTAAQHGRLQAVPMDVSESQCVQECSIQQLFGVFCHCEKSINSFMSIQVLTEQK